MIFTLKKNLALILLVTPLLAQATTVYGPCAFGSVVLTNLTCYGPATLNGTVIRNALTVDGPLDAENVSFKTMNVKGVAHINDSRVSGNVTIYGPLFSNNSRFSGDVYSYTNFMQLVHTLIDGNLTIRSTWQTPTLQMFDASYVKKNVTFSGSTGAIVFNNGSGIKGKVVNVIK